MPEEGSGGSLFSSTADFLDRMPRVHCAHPQPKKYCSLCRRLNSRVAEKCPYSGIYATDAPSSPALYGIGPSAPESKTPGAPATPPAGAEASGGGESQGEGEAAEAKGSEAPKEGEGKIPAEPPKEPKKFKIVPMEAATQISFVSSGARLDEPTEMEVLEEGITFEYEDPNAAEVEEFEDEDDEYNDLPEAGPPEEEQRLVMRPVPDGAGTAPPPQQRPKAKVKVKAKVKTKAPGAPATTPAPPAVTWDSPPGGTTPPPQRPQAQQPAATPPVMRPSPPPFAPPQQRTAPAHTPSPTGTMPPAQAQRPTPPKSLVAQPGKTAAATPEKKTAEAPPRKAAPPAEATSGGGPAGDGKAAARAARKKAILERRAAGKKAAGVDGRAVKEGIGKKRPPSGKRPPGKKAVKERRKKGK